MSRIYQHTLELLPQIKEMLAKGKTHKEIENALGIIGDRPIHNLLKRERRKEKSGVPKQRDRKPAKTLQEYKYENKRLKMENELLQYEYCSHLLGECNKNKLMKGGMYMIVPTETRNRTRNRVKVCRTLSWLSNLGGDPLQHRSYSQSPYYELGELPKR